MTSWCGGNAEEDGVRGWFVGHFATGVRASKDVEIKWFRHPAGDSRPEWTKGDQRTTVVILVEGRFRVELSNGAKLLTSPGDYVMWKPGVEHSWHAEEDSTVITVRWPSYAL